LKFDVVVSKFDEDLDKSTFTSPAAYAAATAMHKAEDVANTLGKAGEGFDLIVGSDTVVEAPDGSILEKPADEKEAMKMLMSLQGVTHQVSTGVGIVTPDPSMPDGRLLTSFSETTRVTFAPLTETEMTAYVKTGEPFDKAGGYGTSRRIARDGFASRAASVGMHWRCLLHFVRGFRDVRLLTFLSLCSAAQVSKVRRARS
jgi:septum formation protein